MLRQPITLDADSVLGSIFVDKQGLPRKVLNNSNFTTAWDATYDEFGTQLTQNGSLNISLRYPGQVFDPATGFMYNWHRWYDPARGRYLSADPLGELGAYPYAGGNPIHFSDSTGMALETPPIVIPDTTGSGGGGTGGDECVATDEQGNCYTADGNVYGPDGGYPVCVAADVTVVRGSSGNSNASVAAIIGLVSGTGLGKSVGVAGGGALGTWVGVAVGAAAIAAVAAAAAYYLYCKAHPEECMARDTSDNSPAAEMCPYRTESITGNRKFCYYQCSDGRMISYGIPAHLTCVRFINGNAS